MKLARGREVAGGVARGPVGTCLDFLAPAACAGFMRSPEPSWLGGRGGLVAIRVGLFAFPGGGGG